MTNSSAPYTKNLTSGRLLAYNTLFNIVGQVVPTLVALLAVPFLIKGLGTDRFGVLSLAWIVIGYFSLFDLGLGRALTQLLAEKLALGDDDNISTLIWTSLSLMLVLGLVGMVVVGLLAPWLTYDVLNIPASIQAETLRSFYLLAASIPIIISSAGLRGILEAHQQFALVNVVRVPMSILIVLGPLLVLPLSHSLIPMIIVLAVIRVAAWIAYLLLCLRVMPILRQRIRLQATVVVPLLRFGSWMTVTNIIGPLMVYLDRFVIGALLSVAAVAFYSTPYEMVTKLLLISAALTGVLFPAFSASLKQDQQRTVMLFQQGVKYTFLLLFPVILIITTLAYEGLHLWLNEEFAQNSMHVLQCLAVGVFLNSLAQIPYTLLQSAGRPDLTAKLHCIELPFYLLSVWWLIRMYGIDGAAIGWVLRVLVDGVILFGMAQQFLPSDKYVVRRFAWLILTCMITLVVGAFLHTLFIKLLFLITALVVFLMATWFLVLDQQEKLQVRAQLKAAQIFN